MTPSRNIFYLLLIATVLSPWHVLLGEEISIEGAPTESGFNVGYVATIHATVKGISGDSKRYAVFAEIQYAGTTSKTDIQMDRVGEPRQGVAEYEIGWPIPPEAPTGLYTVAVQVEDRQAHRAVATKNVRGFGAYKKLIQITHLATDKAAYKPEEPVRCEVTLENLTDSEFKGLRIEFANANYPWNILPVGDTAGENAPFRLAVLRDQVVLPARGTATIPMTSAGAAPLFETKQQAPSGAAGNMTEPKAATYAVAVWNAARTVLYDLQFTLSAMARPQEQVLPGPHTQPGNPAGGSAPGVVSDVITMDRSRTLYRPGDRVQIASKTRNPGHENWHDVELRATVMDASGKAIHQETLSRLANLGPGETQAVRSDAWTIPAGQAPGNYRIMLELLGTDGKQLAKTDAGIAVNTLPASVLVFLPNEDGVSSWAGLIRAAVEAGIPVRVVILTSGDARACGCYYNRICGPSEAREFAMIRMEKSRNALDRLGLARDGTIFLGLPDGGLDAIWSRHLKAENPYLSVALACDHAPFEQIPRPNLPYARDSVMGAIERIISDFHPALIAAPHPDERPTDHRATNWFVLKACRELLREQRMDPNTIIWSNEIRDTGGSRSAPFKYEDAVLFLSGEAAALGQEISWADSSQGGKEMKKDLSDSSRQEKHLHILDWQEHEGWNE